MTESKIASIRSACYRVPLPRVLSDAMQGRIPDFQLVTVQISDNSGNTGLGYTYTVGRGGTAIRALIETDLASLLIGRDPDPIEELWKQMWQRLHYVGRGGVASFAISAVDIALWDLKARTRDISLWRLLGAAENRVPVYAGGINLEYPLEELLRETESSLKRGFRAIKMKVGSPMLETDAERVDAMRRLLGPDFPLMADANMAWSVDEAIAAATAFREFDLHWLEEPIAPDDFPGHARVAREGGIPIAAGENLHTPREFQMLIDSGGVAFVEPDVANIGGITSWLKVAASAEHAGLPVTSHGVHDLHVHLLAAVPNASFLEWHGFGLERLVESPLQLADGCAIAPDIPGHGVTLKWDALDEFVEK